METLNKLIQLEQFINNLNKKYNIKIQISKYNETEKKINILFLRNLEKFYNSIFEKYNINIRYTININYGNYICLARLYDSNSEPNINKRCKNKSCNQYDLCKIHRNKEGNSTWCGRVSENPDENKIIRYYQKNNKKINYYNSINLNHNHFVKNKIYSINPHKKNFICNFKIKIIYQKKNLNLNIYNLDMSTTTETLNIKNKIDHNDYVAENEFYENLEFLYNIDKETYNKGLEKYLIDKYDYISDDVKNIKKIIAKEYFRKITDTEISESESFQIEKHIKAKFNQIKINIDYKNYNKNQELNVIKNIDKYSCESIRFIDNNYLGYDLYYYNIDGKNIVYNSNKKILGYLRDWIDEDEEVPREYKTIDNKVLHPFTKLPIIEIEITKSGSGFEPIKEGLYRECEYNDQLETLTSTNQIIRNS